MLTSRVYKVGEYWVRNSICSKMTESGYSLSAIKGYLKGYHHINSTANDVHKAISMFTTLRPAVERISHDSGESQVLFQLKGTVKLCLTEGSCDLPVVIWLRRPYPDSRPIAYIKPSTTVTVNPSEFVDTRGKLSLPYIENWNKKKSDITTLVKEIILTFSKIVPAQLNKYTAPLSPPPSVPQTVPPAYSTQPSFTFSPPATPPSFANTSYTNYLRPQAQPMITTPPYRGYHLPSQAPTPAYQGYYQPPRPYQLPFSPYNPPSRYPPPVIPPSYPPTPQPSNLPLQQDQQVQSLEEEISQLKEKLKDSNKEIEYFKKKLSDATEAERHTAVALIKKTEDSDKLEVEWAKKLENVTSCLNSSLKMNDASSADDVSFWEVDKAEVESTTTVIGEGAWGKVTVGWFRGQKVALKQMHQLIVSANTITLIRREILLMARVRHPNLLLFIAAVLNHSGGPIIITELLDMSLRTAYMGGKLTSNPVRLSIMRDVAVGLNYLHLQKIPVIHRDISSGNVLLEELANNNWKGKISDFGSANVAQMAMTPGPGALVYAAPEVYREAHEHQTTKIDVYSYGVLFCEVLNNEFPFQENFPTMLERVRDQWAMMHKMILSCTAKNPTDRPTISDIVYTLNSKFFKKNKY